MTQPRAVELAHQVGLDETRAGQVAIVARQAVEVEAWIPELAVQRLSAPANFERVFTLAQGPPAFTAWE